MAKKPKIVIIGAGMAGITAANKLYTSSNNIFELSVVEGSSRIGGRINTLKFSSENIEMGAAWIHGINGNPVYEIAEKIGSLVSEEPWECMDSSKVKYFAEGGFEIESSIVEPISRLFNEFMETAQEEESNAHMIDETDTNSPHSVGFFLKHMFDSCRNSVNDDPSSLKGMGKWSQESLEEAIFTLCCNRQRTYTSADDLSTLDLAAESEYKNFEGDEITIAKGYVSVVNHLASVLPHGVIQFNRKVTKIEWQRQTNEDEDDDDHPVKLHFSDGSFVFADHVIVTVSLGVLKAGIESDGPDGELFNPPLPDFKSEAIKRLGFGVVNKLFVEMSQRNFPSLQLVFDRDDSEFRSEQIPWWMRKTVVIKPTHSDSKVLLSWFAGKEALELEKLTDEEIIDGVICTISCLTGKEVKKDTGTLTNDEVKTPETLTNDEVTWTNGDDDEVMKIRKVLKSKWGSDPLFRGSYSYVAVGSSGDDLDAMAEPLPKINKKVGTEVSGDDQSKIRELQVMFAGEATHRTNYSTTHGAYYSGLREADRLLKYLQI